MTASPDGRAAAAPDERARGMAYALAALFVAAALLIALGFAREGRLPELASRHGASIDATIRYLLIATGVLFLLGHGVLAWFVVRYAGARAHGSPHASGRAEWRVALAPVLVMMVVAEGGVLWVGLPAFAEMYGEPPADALAVEVVGKQFEWLVRYPGPDGVFGRTDAALVHDARNPVGLDKKDPAAKDDVVKRGELHLPVGRSALVRLRALDVIHSFTVPHFRVKQDLIPGFLGRTQFVPTKEGRFELACAELCGLGHYRMRGFIEVQSERDFQAWLAEEEPWF
jgi:cytochrome c oxidase subunit 2